MTKIAEVNGQKIAYSVAGKGPPVLLLHGFPQTREMWVRVVPTLASEFTVVTADLRGYGASSKPKGVENYCFREMAADQNALMISLGFDRYHLVGHDRGARTAHRLALDCPNTLQSLTLMDIVPTHHLLEDLNLRVARAYYHWFFLAQPAPLPEVMIGHDPDRYFESCLQGWGPADLSGFDEAALISYRTAWRDPETIVAMCNDYRAAIDIDFAQDALDLDRQVACPALVLYGVDGIMDQTYDVAATWAPRLSNMRATAVPGGHFFVDRHPEATAATLLSFLQQTSGS